MKKYVKIAAVVNLVLLASCKNPQTNETVVRERDSLIAVIDEKEKSVNEFIASFNEVEENLNNVTRKQHVILENSKDPFKGEFNLNKKEQINSEIKAINDLMTLNTDKLKKLNSSLSKSGKKNSQLAKTIDVLNNQLNQKYIELKELNAKLSSLNSQVELLQIDNENLSNQNAIQADMIDYAIIEIHKAYYIVDKSKYLQDCSMIDKTGGLLGIGKTFKLNENIDNSLFTKIDYTLTNSIPINSNSIKIITTHPIDSYTLNKTGKLINSIEITDPVKFWSVSKYLVVIN